MQEEFEDTKGVLRIRISKKNGQHNDQKKKGQKDKQRFTKHTHKTKDRVTRTPLKIEEGTKVLRNILPLTLVSMIHFHKIMSPNYMLKFTLNPVYNDKVV